MRLSATTILETSNKVCKWKVTKAFTLSLKLEGGKMIFFIRPYSLHLSVAVCENGIQSYSLSAQGNQRQAAVVEQATE